MTIMKRLTGYRFVDILHGDSLQQIAQRELGDAARWAELIAINDLAPPFLTGDPLEAGPKVKLYGQQLVVPATSVQTSAASDPERVFGVDLLLRNGLLEASGGDLTLVAGRDNLRQALTHAVRTALNELLFHRSYGCGVHRLKGKPNTPTAAVLGAEYVRGTLLNDPRVASVPESSVRVEGDINEIAARAKTIAGTSVDILSAV